MSIIQSIQCRQVLNTHVQFTNEFIVSLADGPTGIGASPQGETISKYEDKQFVVDPTDIVSEIQAHELTGRPVSQTEFDTYLLENVAHFGRNNIYALSEALFNARSVNSSLFDLLGRPPTKLNAPRLCMNVLNGGSHAYTNPVLSDYSEYILVAHSNDIGQTIGAHNEIQRVVKERLSKNAKTIVNGHPVNRFATADNRECVDFLLGVCESLGYANSFDLWIDASAGDLWTDNGYRLALTSNALYTSEQYQAYWLDIINQYGLRFVEDPFREDDYESWHRLTTGQRESLVIGDNFYSSNPTRIEEGARRQFAHGVLVKPNQAGTVTEVCKAIETAQRFGQVVVTSHRSISTESTFLSTLTCMFGVEYIKIGPLATDYSSVMRLNEIIRIAGA
jgi:enolase